MGYQMLHICHIIALPDIYVTHKIPKWTEGSFTCPETLPYEFLSKYADDRISTETGLCMLQHCYNNTQIIPIS